VFENWIPAQNYSGFIRNFTLSGVFKHALGPVDVFENWIPIAELARRGAKFVGANCVRPLPHTYKLKAWERSKD
jgi:hypothetical protein